MSRHLIHIGFPKAGSTTLTAWFDQHPQLEFAPNGVGGYYHAFEIAARAAEPRPRPPLWQVTSSESLSSPRESDAVTVAGAWSEARPSIADSRVRVCQTLHRLSPTATMLIVTRGFKSALASGYSQYVRQGGRLTQSDLLAVHSEHGASVLDYDGTVGLYEEAFGPERVVVMPYELLRDDPHAFFGALAERLELDAGPDAVPRLNPSLSPAAIVWYRRLSAVAALVVRPLGARAGRLAYAAYVSRIERKPLRPVVALLDRVLPARGLTAADIPDEAVELFRGRATGLAGRPHYAPYAADYLNAAPRPEAGT